MGLDAAGIDSLYWSWLHSFHKKKYFIYVMHVVKVNIEI